MRPLAGCGVLVTRPAAQAGPLCEALAAAGARVHTLPALTITPLAPPPVQACDWLVFISANAVQHAGPWLPPPPGTRVAAVGPATATALQAAGVTADACGADGRGAQALLDDPRFTPASGTRVCIVRGVGGSDRLADALRERGVETTYVEVYRRDPPAEDPGPRLAAARADGVDAVLFASASALETLHSRLDAEQRAWLATVQVVGVSPRVVDLARSLGLPGTPLVVAEASDAAQVAALADWWRQRTTDQRT